MNRIASSRSRERDTRLLFAVAAFFLIAMLLAPGAALAQPPWPATASSDGEWSELFSPTRGFAAVAYDAARARVILLAGFDGVFHSDVWVLTPGPAPSWSRLAVSGATPPARARFSAIHDPSRDRVVIFGGYDGVTRRNDVWALSLGGTPAWTEIVPAGPLPAGRSGHGAIYDPVDDRMVVFGGWSGATRNDTWALSLGGTPAWSDLAPAGTLPAARYGHTFTYDPVAHRVVVFGGFDGILRRNDCWTLSLGAAPAWQSLVTAGTRPAARYEHTAVYDAGAHRMVCFGGYSTWYSNDAWSLSLDAAPTWTSLAASGPVPAERAGHAAVYDPSGDRMIVAGGYNGQYLADTQALSLGASPAWSELVPSGTLLSGRMLQAMIHDPLRDRLVVFGGTDAGGRRNDTWVLPLSGGATGWTQLATAGTPPTARERHTAIYDPVRDRMVVFGGYDVAYRNDLWTLTFAGTPTWTPLAAGSRPPSRAEHVAIYDPVRDQMVMFGGTAGSSLLYQDTWTLTFGGSPAWHELDPPPLWPIQRYGHSAIYDAVRDRMLIFGGREPSLYDNDTWALSLADTTWTRLHPTGSLPAARTGHAAVHDAQRDRMVVFGGFDGAYYNDTWSLALAGTPAWSALAPAGPLPPARHYHSAVADPLRDRMLMVGGTGASLYGETRALTWSAATSVASGSPGDAGRERAGRPVLHSGMPNPFVRGTSTILRYESADAAARITVHDVRGRLVRALTMERAGGGATGGGLREVAWDGRDAAGQPVTPGIYLCRLEASGMSATRKIVMVE